MNDHFLFSLRQEPPAAFAAQLRQRLADPRATPDVRPAGRRLRRTLKGLAAAAAIGLMFSVPAVRASAQSFLALFRAETFIGVPVDGSRVTELGEKIDLETLLGGHVNMIQCAPCAPVEVATPELAAAGAGFDLRLPTRLPAGTSLTRTMATGPTVMQLNADSAALQSIMDALAIDDLQIPPALDGQVVTLRISPVVTVQYSAGTQGWGVELVQALAPEVAVPSGVDIAVLGEIGLRILGLSRSDAHDIARAIDWQTTLLVPLPPLAESFRQVEVGGAHGLLVQIGRDSRRSTALLWSANGRAYAIRARGLTEDQVLDMADSIQ